MLGLSQAQTARDMALLALITCLVALAFGRWMKIRGWSRQFLVKLRLAFWVVVAQTLLTLAVLGGCFVPRWVMPEWLQMVGLLTPHAWAVDAYQALMVQGAGLLEVVPAVAVLAVFATVFFGVGVWRFRFE